MRFNRLRLNGFKSFVDPTDLVIADGLTGVVGPNGCGKSNLLEALRWVMGENRPKAMRGGGMEDVIFAGAATRPARNFAEVSLHIDNSERLAPQGFNEADSLDVIRRITRDIGSAYKTNGKDVRARDVQMLFADASTGAHSPALVRQGQISELINAKPRARRRILEEAAGISGLYQRRHEAELKLKNTDANLLRVDDVLEQLAAQLTQLARQAKQAARYRAIGEDLRRAEAALLYRRWSEADAQRLVAESALREKLNATAAAERAARDATAARTEAEAQLPPLREEETIAAAVQQRLLVERDTLSGQETQASETITRLKRRIDQLGKDIDREIALNRDAGEMIERLDWEGRELAKAADGQDERLAEAQAKASEAADVLQDREATLGEATEDAARLAARHQSATRLVADSTKARERALAEAKRAREAAQDARAKLNDATTRQSAAAKEQAQALTLAEAAETALSNAEIQRGVAQSAETEARSSRAEAEGETATLRAEVTALARVLEREASDQTALLDALVVESGYEKALGAALGDDLRAAEVSDNSSGWRRLAPYEPASSPPVTGQPLSAHVGGPDVLARRLGQVFVTDVQNASSLQPNLKPGQRLVSRNGDLWRWDGFQLNAADAPSAAALRLEQTNRLTGLRRELDTAEARRLEAVAAHDSLSAKLTKATEADQSARAARRDADTAVAQAGRALSQAEADCNLARGKVETLTMAASRHDEDAASATQQLADAKSALAELGDLDEARAQVEDIRTTVEAARMLMMSRRSEYDELRREGESRRARSQQVTKDLSGWRHRLATAEARASELAERRQAAETELVDAIEVPKILTTRRTDLAEALRTSQNRQAAAEDARRQAEAILQSAVKGEKDAERSASDAREARAASDARAEAAQTAVIEARQRMLDETGHLPAELLAELNTNADDLPDADDLDTDVQRLKRQRDALGAVNLRAEEDARTVQDEYDTLRLEKLDLEEAIKTLRSGIASLNREGRERLLTAFEQVNSNFGMLFTHLFGGGEANLVMVESDDPLDAGLEIMCQPPGKKLSTLSLLSGGEQTLTALALIFAVFLANPAPICVLDEVDAPLDDANVSRFCDMLDEMCRRTNTRFLIITHHAVTMARMDRLFGVTMQEQGVSQLVSVDLKRAERMVA